MTSKSIGFVVFLCLVLAPSCAPFSKADSVTHDYTGNPFIFFLNASCPPACSVTGSFTVSSPLTANFLDCIPWV
jgi:hypothetical protein